MGRLWRRHPLEHQAAHGHFLQALLPQVAPCGGGDLESHAGLVVVDHAHPLRGVEQDVARQLGPLIDLEDPPRGRLVAAYWEK